MKKNTMKKSVIATVLATSLFTSTSVGFASNSLQDLVDQARKDMKEAAYAYVVPSQNGRVATSLELYPALNLAKANYQKAKKAIEKSNAPNKDALLRDLNDLYYERITKGIIPYIDAYNYADKYLTPIMADLKKAESERDWDKVENLYHKLSVQLKTRTDILYRFTGKAARDLLLEQYKDPANLKRDQLMVPVTLYMKVKEADRLLNAGRQAEAIRVLETIKPLLYRLPSTASLPMMKELLEKLEAVSIKAGVIIVTPPTTPSSGGGGGGGNSGSKNFNLSIMHVNDIHANTDKAPKLVTAVKEVRKVKPNALLLNAGDTFSGTLYFNEFLGQADLAFMNLMKVDAMTFGNHEFDLGSSAEGHQALVDFIEAAKFPFVSANVDFSQDEKFKGLFNTKIPSKASNGNIYSGIVKVVNGEKVGIFGLTTAETKDISSPGKITFSNYIEDAKRMVAEFEAMGINKIVALTHIGFDDNAAMDNDQELAAKVAGIDVIVGGHSHTQLPAPVVVVKDDKGKAKDKTIIVQAYQYADYLGTLDVEFDKKGVVVGHSGKLIKTADKAEDVEAAALLKPYKDQIKAVNEEFIGVTLEKELLSPRTTDKDFVPGTSVRASETILGNLITDGMLAKAKKYVKDKNIIMAFQNGGGIRASINAGPITVGEVITVLPFGNTLATMDLTGAEIKETFEISLKDYPKESGGFLHVSGAKVEFDSSKPTGKRVVSIAYKNADNTYTEIQNSETYTIATNAFTAKGGDGYDVLKKAYEKGRATDLGLSDWENLREHLVSVKDSIPTKIEGRIVDVKGDGSGTELPGGNIEAKDFSGTPDALKVYKGDVTVSITDVSLLENAVVKGNLTIIGTPTGSISFKNITVEGDFDISSLEGKAFDLNDLTVAGDTKL
ncbi:5'-nucleotidase C-terminal domain-containing protein [Psychrobacillus sp.]|uniref:5'-nucleotidase C-terminal domain-containing protein n=1 Tax=Psychrobacillus sp. TaxID=1871623 RepID=UPI0028BF5663|nr:5'-nucleotidase C-terminal domain-containing protein [Psychrobacillus sp.]